MDYIAIVNKNTGVLDFVGNVLDGNKITLKEDKFVVFDVDTTVRMETHYYLDGVFCQYTPEEINQRARVPAGFVWKMPERTIVDCRSLQQAKDQKWKQIKNIRTQKENSTFSYNGNEFHADKEHIPGAVQLAMMAKSAGQPFSINWTLDNNSVISLNADQMIEVGVALGTFINNLYDIARQLREEIESCSTVQDVDAIVWPDA